MMFLCMLLQTIPRQNRSQRTHHPLRSNHTKALNKRVLRTSNLMSLRGYTLSKTEHYRGSSVLERKPFLLFADICGHYVMLGHTHIEVLTIKTINTRHSTETDAAKHIFDPSAKTGHMA